MSHFVSTALICTGDAGHSAGVKDLNYANLNIASNNWTTLCFGQCCQVFLQQIDQILSKNVPNAYKNHRCNCVRLQKFFQGGQTRHFAYPFHVADDAMKMHVHKTLYPFYTMTKMCPWYGSSRKNSASLVQQCFFFIHGSFHTAQ